MGFDFMFSFFPIMFGLVFLLVMGVFITVFVRGAKEWNKNNNSPRLTVDAEVIAKRQQISSHGSGRDHSVSHHSRYYVTFQFESGDRMELGMSGSEYGLLLEGDRGKLSFQGTRYLGFERIL